MLTYRSLLQTLDNCYLHSCPAEYSFHQETKVHQADRAMVTPVKQKSKDFKYSSSRKQLGVVRLYQFCFGPRTIGPRMRFVYLRNNLIIHNAKLKESNNYLAMGHGDLPLQPVTMHTEPMDEIRKILTAREKKRG